MTYDDFMMLDQYERNRYIYSVLMKLAADGLQPESGEKFSRFLKRYFIEKEKAGRKVYDCDICKDQRFVYYKEWSEDMHRDYDVMVGCKCRPLKIKAYKEKCPVCGFKYRTVKDQLVCSRRCKDYGTVASEIKPIKTFEELGIKQENVSWR